MEVGPGHVLGRYELLLPIAAGGMAMVWAARLKGTRGFQKIVAVKTMLPKLSEDDQFEQMFLDEASLASQIRHPHVVEIQDLGEQEGVLFLAMEWIDGVPLNQLMKSAKPEGGIPLPIAIRLVMQASAGMHAAHELRDPKGTLVGLVHRDISPQNILVTYDGVVKVVDFGVAKATALGGGATMAGQLKGKVSYMAPEQVRGETLDRRVDIFAMGIVLYALTTGKHPFRRESEGATMYAISSPDPVVLPSKFLPDYPKALEAVLEKALAKDQSQRYSTANDLLRALDQVLPPTERAIDEDVATFVTKLLGKQRDSIRVALAEALERADKKALTGSVKMDPVKGASHSGVSSITHTGVDASLAPSSVTESMVLSGVAAAQRKRRTAFTAVAVLTLAAIGAGITTALLTSEDPAPPTGAPAAHPAAPGASHAIAAAAHDPGAPKVDLESLPVEPGEPANSAQPIEGIAPDAPGAPPRRRGAARPAPADKAQPPPPPPAGSAPAGATKPKWKHDPGF